jgi:capsular polysaccharide biosynthesis protein
MVAEPTPAYDEEIDLRAIFQTLWKARIAILITTLAAAIVAFAVSFWILPRKYQAITYMFIGQPAIEYSKAQSDSGFAYSPTLPDIKAVVKLSNAPALLESVLKDQKVVTAFGNQKIPLSKMTDMTTAVDIGKDQISLQVTDTDPQRAALLANTLAEKVASMVNTIYGPEALAQTLDTQVLQSQQDYEKAQAALEAAVSKSQVSALSAQLDTKRADLSNVLSSIIRTRNVLDDLQFFEQGLSGLSGETTLALGDGLALTTLRQRSLTVASESFTVQIDSASFAGFTVSKALEATTQMRAGLQSQLTRLQSDQSSLEQEIPQLQGDLEETNAQMSQFTLKRDQSAGLYASLLQQQRLVITVLAQSSKVASVSVTAVPPTIAISRNTVRNTVLAGMLGLIVSALWVLALTWWKTK